MIGGYGWIAREGADRITRAIPENREDVAVDYMFPEGRPPSGGPNDDQMRRSFEGVEASVSIKRALRSGDLVAIARRNGSGDVVPIEPREWHWLKFRSITGHDLAVPADDHEEELPLPYSDADYLSAKVPAHVTPAVWPDPLFEAKRIQLLWPVQPAAAGQAGAPGTVANTELAGTLVTNETAIYRTGLPGKPTSWHLIETECRRRYESGERHPQTTVWARVLRDWFRSKHPDAPSPTEKTLKNKLARLLRELRANEESA